MNPRRILTRAAITGVSLAALCGCARSSTSAEVVVTVTATPSVTATVVSSDIYFECWADFISDDKPLAAFSTFDEAIAWQKANPALSGCISQVPGSSDVPGGNHQLTEIELKAVELYDPQTKYDNPQTVLQSIWDGCVGVEVTPGTSAKEAQAALLVCPANTPTLAQLKTLASR